MVIEMKKLSIITITYNDLNNLKLTINSVINEINDRIEYVIIDGASKDGSVDYLNTIVNQNVCIFSEPDKGIYNAMNKGIKKSHGEWVLFLNSGDVLLPGTLPKILMCLDEQYDCFYGDIYLSLCYQGKQYYKKEKASPIIDLNNLRKHMLFSHQALLCKRNVLVKVNGFDEKFRTAADWDLIIRITKKKVKYKYLDTTIAIYDKTGVSSKPHPIEKHYIRKKNNLYRIIDTQYFRDLLQACIWYITAFILKDSKMKYQIKYRNYLDHME